MYILSMIFSSIKKPFVWFWYTRKRNKALAIFLLLIIFGIVSWQVGKLTEKPTYTASEAKKRTIVEIVSEAGTIGVDGKTDVYSPTHGVVEEVYVNNGETVIVGQELFKIKSAATDQEKTQALANYMSAKNTLDAAQARLHTLQSQMFAANQTFINGKGNTNDPVKDDPNYIQENADWLAAEAAYKNQQAVIAAANTALATASLAYQATQNAVVKATADGEIANLSVKAHSSVKANSPTSPATPLATITTSTIPEVVVSLSENDIAKVATGQEVAIDVSAIQEKTYQGVVSRVDSIGSNDNGVIRYKVYIEVQDADTKLRPGMNVDVVITTQKIANVLTVPNAAVKPYQGGRAVRVPDGKTDVKYVPVKIGVKGEKETQILSGIKEGQLVITSLSNEAVKRAGPFGG